MGDQAPDFSLVDQEGKPFTLSKVKNKNVVLYFYPADDTPGCTKQACSFRDSFDVFRELGAEVVGISGDSPESHKVLTQYALPRENIQTVHPSELQLGLMSGVRRLFG